MPENPFPVVPFPNIALSNAVRLADSEYFPIDLYPYIVIDVAGRRSPRAFLGEVVWAFAHRGEYSMNGKPRTRSRWSRAIGRLTALAGAILAGGVRAAGSVGFTART
ncbi:hypothetical protein GCM10010452_64290 [Crossiella cryophila]